MRRRTQRGGVFIITLAILSALVLVLAAAARSQHMAARAQANRMDERIANLAAMAGIQRALATLSTQVASPTTSQDDWATLGTNGTDIFTDGAGQCRIQIIDAASLININSAQLAQLQKLPLTQAQIDAILDFRTAGTTPRPDGGKDEYYNNLQTPYNAKLLPFETVDELLQVKDITPAVLYEPQSATLNTSTPLVAESDGLTPVLADLLTVDSVSTPTSAAGANLPTLATAPIQRLQQVLGSQALAVNIFQRRTTFTTLGQVLATPGFTNQTAKAFVNAFRVGNGTTQQGRINLNTATDNVLNTVPNLTPDIVSAIIAKQGGGFTQLGDLFDVAGYSARIASQTIDQFSVNSSVFIIRVVGQRNTTNLTNLNTDTSLGTQQPAKVALIAIVRITANQPPKILRIERPPQSDVETSHWGWDMTQAGTTTDLKGGQ